MLQIIQQEEEQLGVVIEDNKYKKQGRKMEIPTFYFAKKVSYIKE